MFLRTRCIARPNRPIGLLVVMSSCTWALIFSLIVAALDSIEKNADACPGAVC